MQQQETLNGLPGNLITLSGVYQKATPNYQGGF
jgi:hypothetical protein